MINIIINNNKNNTTTTQRITPKERKLDKHDTGNYNLVVFSSCILLIHCMFKFEFEK